MTNIQQLAVLPGQISPRAGIVLYRGLAGDTLALLVSELITGATLIILDRCMLTPGQPQAIEIPGQQRPAEILVLGRVEKGVQRGYSDDSYPRPNWYPADAQFDAQVPQASAAPD